MMIDQEISQDLNARFSPAELINLLAFNQAINTAKTTNELLANIREKVKQFIPFYDTGILIVIKDGLHHYDMAVNFTGWDDSAANLVLQQQKQLHMIPHRGSYVEFVINKLKDLNSPIIENWETVFEQWQHPFFSTMKQFGYKDGMVTLLKSSGRVYGAFWLNSLDQEHFKAEQFPVFLAIAEQVSVAVANILAHEEILEREREKTKLLEISEAIATVQNGKQLLKIIYEKIKPILDYDNAGLFILGDDGQSVFEVTDSEILRDDLQAELDSKNLLGPFPMNGVTEDFWFHYKAPSITNFKLQASYVTDKEGKKHFEIAINHGLKELICGPLQCRGKKIGMLCFNTKNENFYNNEDIDFFRSISDLIAIALANIIANEELLKREREKTLLLNISNAIARINNKVDLLRSIDELLWPIFHHDDAGFNIVDKEKKYFVDYYSLYSNIIPNSEESKYLNEVIYKQIYDVSDLKLPLLGSIVEHFMKITPTGGKLKDVLSLNRNADMIQLELDHQLEYYICSPLSVSGNTFGLFNLLFKDENKPGPSTLGLFSRIADIMALAFSNILAKEEILERENEKSILLSISEDISSIRNSSQLFDVMTRRLKTHIQFDEAVIMTFDKERKNYTDLFSTSSLAGQLTEQNKPAYFPITGIMRHMIETGNHMVCRLDTLIQKNPGCDRLIELNKKGIVDIMAVPLKYASEIIGFLMLYAKKESTYTEERSAFIVSISHQLSMAVSNILAYERLKGNTLEIERLNSQLKAQNSYLIEEVEQQYNFDEMIGQNTGFNEVCKNIGLVAKTDSTVLILGETGTGKELVARAIHNHSLRNKKPLIKLNCAALPASLIESELFGHERGAFTGAIEKRIGKFELANGSTLFLDEVGELPLELQAKLLRALQEKEIERLGSNKTMKVDVRIIAATNRDIEKDVEAGKFRHDLYYRLHIFPVNLPALRERKEDIPLLAVHFLERYARKNGKRIDGFSNKAMQEMMSYTWPGNIRELEHAIERSVILNNNRLIQNLDLPGLSKKSIIKSSSEFIIKTWEEQERDYILEVLKITNGKIKGNGGAAVLLQLPPTTLQSKMEKLGIRRKYFSDKEEQ